MKYRVRYRAGSIDGAQTVHAMNAEEAIVIVRTCVRIETGLPVNYIRIEDTEDDGLN